MYGPVRAVLVAAVLGLFVIGGVSLVPRSGDVGGPTIEASPSPAPSPTPTPARLPDGPVPAGTYVAMPFTNPGSDACFSPPQPGCREAISDDDIRFTFTVPDGLSGTGDLGVGLPLDDRNTPTWANIILERGAWLLTDPCTTDVVSDLIPVGPTAADFADALVAHPLLDVTTPVDVTLAGYSGTYLELQAPLDLTGCYEYQPWAPAIWARWPGERWLLTILDVEGLRVVIREMVHEGTTPEVLAKLQGVIDSITIEGVPPTAPAASPSSGPLAWSPASLEQDWPAPVRAEPAGDPVVIPLADGEAGYTDPSGDIESPDMPWIDIERVWDCGSICVDLGGSAPSPNADTNEPWIVYGLVVDTDLDGVADVRLGMDIMPLGPRYPRALDGSPSVWSTDLHTGQNAPAYLGDFLYPGETGTVAHIWPKQGIPGRFYAWASVIQNGRVVATDYAPDTGWLDSTGSIPGGTPAASSPP